MKKNPIILSGHVKWNGIPMLRVELWYGRGTCNADEVNRTANVCGRLLHNVLHAPGWCEQYVTGCLSLRSFPAFPSSFLREGVRERGSTGRGLDWQSEKKKNNRRENVWKKNDECFSPNEQDTKLGCSVAMATPARQLAFFVGGCAIIFDEQSGAHNCK